VRQYKRELLALRPPWTSLRRPLGAGHNRPRVPNSIQLSQSKPPANAQPDRSRNQRSKAKVEVVKEHGKGNAERLKFRKTEMLKGRKAETLKEAVGLLSDAIAMISSASRCD
jgi:hypothetical protein